MRVGKVKEFDRERWGGYYKHWIVLDTTEQAARIAVEKAVRDDLGRDHASAACA